MNDDTTNNNTSSNSADNENRVNNQYSTDENYFNTHMSGNKDVQAAFDQLTRKDSLKYTDINSSSTSFTQRLIDRGVTVPSFPNWEEAKSNTHHHHQELSSSSGSLINEFDSSAYYGLSPFVTSSFSGTGSHSFGTNSNDTRTALNNNDPKYVSLRHRYERENNYNISSISSHPYHINQLHQKYKARKNHYENEDGVYENIEEVDEEAEEEDRDDDEVGIEEEEEEEEENDADYDDDDDENTNNTKNNESKNKKKFKRTYSKYSQNGESDIDLSDDDLEKPSTRLAISGKKISNRSHQLPLKKTSIDELKQINTVSESNIIDDKEDTPPPPSSLDKLRKMMSKKGYKGFESTNSIENNNDNSDLHHQHHHHHQNKTNILQQLNHTHTKINSESDSASHLSPDTSTSQKTKKLLHKTPRSHLLQTPVYDLINGNPNNVRDRYLFLFSDLLLICDPIMDENIIVGSSSNSLNNNGPDESRYRFRPNESSLFQVKNIVELNKLTLYLTQEDIQHQHSSSTSSALNNSAAPSPSILPPRKIHPTMATALRKFESDAESGINFLIDKQLLTSDPLSIASFLFKIGDLNRSQLGKYLGDKNNSDVYDAFLDYFRLVGLRLDEALRILLTTFRLPSQWESLEYLIERFAKKWHDANQNVVKFHEDMVVKVVVSMLFLNSEIWYDANSDHDVFWYARKRKEQKDRQRLTRRATAIDERKNPNRVSGLAAATAAATESALSSSSKSKHIFNLQSHQSLRTHYHHRDSVAVEPLHYITALREKTGKLHKPTINEYLERWSYFDQYTLVPREFMEDMYKSISSERLETGWDNKSGPTKDGDHNYNYNYNNNSNNKNNDINEDRREMINITPHRLPTRLIKGVPSVPITVSITQPDPGLQIKLRGQDLVMEPSLLDFSASPTQTFTITGNTLGRTSLMFIKYGNNSGNYVSPGLTRTKPIVVEAPLMRFTFQIEFSHADINAVKAAAIKAVTSKANSTNLSSSPPTNTDIEHNNNNSNINSNNINNDLKHPFNNTIKNLKKKEIRPTEMLRRGSVATLAALTSSALTNEEDETETSTSPSSSSMIEPDGSNLLPKKSTMVKRRYTFSVETEHEKMAWVTHLSQLCGCVIITGGDLNLPASSASSSSTVAASSSSSSSSSLPSSHNKHTRNVYRKKLTLLPSPEERVALQVLKELLLADEIKKGTASVAMRTSTPATATKKNLNESEIENDQENDPNGNGITTTTTDLLIKKASSINLKLSSDEKNKNGLLNVLANKNSDQENNDDDDSNGNDPTIKKLNDNDDDNNDEENHNSLVSLSGGANVVTKRGNEIIKLVVQNSMVPFMLGFLRSQID